MTNVRRRIHATERPGCPEPGVGGRSPASYVRRARALRGRLGRKPVELHRALRDLNAAQPALPTPTQAVSPAQAFYAAAEAAFDGGTLRYSQRLALLALAHTLEIPRGRANLIIASVQHARRTAVEPPPARGWILPISLGFLLQAAILISAVVLLRP